MGISIQFLGAAGTVTGSKFLIKTGLTKLMVDCGMFQGLKPLRELNWAKLPVEPREIDAVFLTHGHLDHIGYLPRLVKFGFHGKVFATKPTVKLAEIILEDSGQIQEEEAVRANQKGYTKHKPALALYTSADVEYTIPLIEDVDDNIWHEYNEHIKFRFLRNGHIIGSSRVEIEIDGKRIVFSGDIGRFDDDMFLAPMRPKRADILIIESTYGDRLHPKTQTNLKIRDVILENHEKHGTLIIPSFTVDRAQDIMYQIWVLKSNGDQHDILKWVEKLEKQPEKVFIAHGEPQAANALRVKLKDTYGWNAMKIPQLFDTFDL